MPIFYRPGQALAILTTRDTLRTRSRSRAVGGREYRNEGRMLGRAKPLLKHRRDLGKVAPQHRGRIEPEPRKGFAVVMACVGQRQGSKRPAQVSRGYPATFTSSFAGFGKAAATPPKIRQH